MSDSQQQVDQRSTAHKAVRRRWQAGGRRGKPEDKASGRGQRTSQRTGQTERSTAQATTQAMVTGGRREHNSTHLYAPPAAGARAPAASPARLWGREPSARPMAAPNTRPRGQRQPGVDRGSRVGASAARERRLARRRNRARPPPAGAAGQGSREARPVSC